MREEGRCVECECACISHLALLSVVHTLGCDEQASKIDPTERLQILFQEEEEDTDRHETATDYETRRPVLIPAFRYAFSVSMSPLPFTRALHLILLYLILAACHGERAERLHAMISADRGHQLSLPLQGTHSTEAVNSSALKHSLHVS